MTAPTSTFTAMDALRFGFSRYAQEAGYCFVFLGFVEIVLLWSAATAAFLMVTLAQLIMQLDAAPPDSYFYAFVISYLVIRSGGQGIVNKWMLMMYDGQKVPFAELLGYDFIFHMPLMIKMVAASLVFNFYVIFGTFLFVLPGLFASSTLRFYKFVIAEQEVDSIDGLRQSYEISGAYKGELVALNVMTSLLKAVGALFFGVGLIPACAISGFAEAYAYKRLLSAED